jgi:hypothetical protein
MGFNRRVWSRAALGRIDEQLIWAVSALAAINAELFLSGLPFPEEVSPPNLLDRIIGLNVHQFTNPIPNSVAAWDAVEIRTRILMLYVKPFTRTRCVLFL